jgi:hypothetical protein
MIRNLPLYIVIVFILTTLLTVGIFQYAMKRGAFSSSATKFLNFAFPFWLIFQATVAVFGFYNTQPMRLPFFAVLPTIITIICLFIFSREWILRLPLQTLTILHIVRIPVELCLLWLFQSGQIPQIMTFEGINFDILSGLTAPIIAFAAFRNGKTERLPLIVWNIAALILLTVIVRTAVLSVPSQFQQFGFDQPNVAVLYFPFIWLPAVIVPIVLFSHLASLWKLVFHKQIMKPDTTPFRKN